MRHETPALDKIAGPTPRATRAAAVIRARRGAVDGGDARAARRPARGDEQKAQGPEQHCAGAAVEGDLHAVNEGLVGGVSYPLAAWAEVGCGLHGGLERGARRVA